MRRVAVFGLAILLVHLMAVSVVLAQAEPAPAPQASAQEAPATTAFDPSTLPEVVARVNGTNLTKDDLMQSAKMVLSQMPQGGQPPADFYPRVLDELVSSELLFQAVKANELLPSDADVDAEITERKKQLPDEETFNKLLQDQGMTLLELREEVRRGLGIQRFIEAKLVPNVVVSTEQARGFYDENLDKMKQGQGFRAAHILFRVEEAATDAQKLEVKQKAESIRGMIDAGQDFADLASRNSDDPGSKANGGELPWMNMGQTVPPFEKAALALEPGQLSAVVETQFGYHIIKLLEKRDEGTVPFDEARERIEFFLKRQNLQEAIEGEVERLKTTGNVEILI